MNALLDIRGRLQIMVGPVQKDCVRARLENSSMTQFHPVLCFNSTNASYEFGG